MQAQISIESEAGFFAVSGPTGTFGADAEGVALDRSPKGPFSTEFTTTVVSSAQQVGGFVAGQEVPVRRMTLTFHLFDMGDGIEATLSRFRLLWGSPVSKLLPVTWRYTSEYSGERWLTMLLEKEVLIAPEQDFNNVQYLKAVVSVVCLEPRYESEQFEVTATNPSSGEHTIWVPVWNPTDQDAWPEWALNPNGDECEFSLPDFGFGNEQEIDATWTPGDHDDRMVTTVPIEVMWSGYAHRGMDPWVAADLSNAPGQMQGVRLLYWLPPHTGSESDPVMLPVIIDGPAGAEAKLILRRWWSAESGLE